MPLLLSDHHGQPHQRLAREYQDLIAETEAPHDSQSTHHHLLIRERPMETVDRLKYPEVMIVLPAK